MIESMAGQHRATMPPIRGATLVMASDHALSPYFGNGLIYVASYMLSRPCISARSLADYCANYGAQLFHPAFCLAGS